MKTIKNRLWAIVRVVCLLVAMALIGVTMFNLGSQETEAAGGLPAVGSEVSLTATYNGTDYATEKIAAGYYAFCINAAHDFVMPAGNGYSGETRKVKVSSVNNLITSIKRNNSNTGYIWSSQEDAEKYLKRCLYYGSVGQAAKSEIGLSGMAYYTVTQDAVWQLTHFGAKWKSAWNPNTKTFTGISASNLPKQDIPNTSFVHDNPQSVYKLMQIVFDTANYPDPQGMTMVVLKDLRDSNGYTYTGSEQYRPYQDLIIAEIEPGMKTRVSVIGNESSASNSAVITADKAASITEVIDYIDYWNLTPNAVYEVTGTLYEAGTNKVIASNTENITATKANGTWEMKFTFAAGTLQAGKTYYVSEKAVGSKVNISHSGKDDKAQTFKVEDRVLNPGLKTKVTVAGQTSTENGAVEITAEQAKSIIEVSDEIEYWDMKQGEIYNVTGALYEAGNSTPIAVNTEPKKADTANGTWEMKLTFDAGSLKAGKTYYVTEQALGSSGTHNHDGSKYVAQQFKVKEVPLNPGLKTRVSVFGRTSSADKSVELTGMEAAGIEGLVDYIDYWDFIPNTEYNISGALYEAGNNIPVATAEAKLSSGTGKGTWSIPFKFNKGTLQAGKTYYVSETVIGGGNTHTHNGSNDKAQTFRVQELLEGGMGTRVSVIGEGTNVYTSNTGKSAALTEYEAAAVTTVTDYIDYWNLIPGTTYNVTGTLYKEGVAEPIATVTEQRKAENTTGTWTITFTFAAGTLKPGTYFVSEKAINPALPEVIVEHIGRNDNAQTFIVEKKPEGGMKTRVSVVERESNASTSAVITAEEAAKVTRIIDYIDYWDLVPNAEYNINGAIYEAGSNTPVATAEAIKTASEIGSGTWSVPFVFEAGELKPGKTYYVSERAVNANDSNDIIEHNGSNDNAQTFIVEEKPEGGMKTRVSVIGTGTNVYTSNENTSAVLTEEEAAAVTTVTDYIDYWNLTVGDKYTVTGTLYEEGNANPIATVTEEKTATTANGTWDVTFTFAEGTLKPGTYFVSERAVNVNNTNEIIEHNGRNDVSQTFIVEEKPPTTASTTVTTVEKPTTTGSTTTTETPTTKPTTRATVEKPTTESSVTPTVSTSTPSTFGGGTAPKTGDTNMILLLVSALGMCLCAIALVLEVRRSFINR